MPAAPTIYEIEVTLIESDPPIWRRFAVPADITLEKLHHVVQAVMGWTDSHLHLFETADGVRYESKNQFLEPDPAMLDERRAKLNEVLQGAGESLLYSYDFGDGWEHIREVTGIGPPADGVLYPVCLEGERACPPEDCGWLTGYYDLLNAAAEPGHPEHEDAVEWLGEDFEPDLFDLDMVNALLARQRPRRSSRTQQASS